MSVNGQRWFVTRAHHNLAALLSVALIAIGLVVVPHPVSAVGADLETPESAQEQKIGSPEGIGLSDQLPAAPGSNNGIELSDTALTSGDNWTLDSEGPAGEGSLSGGAGASMTGGDDGGTNGTGANGQELAWQSTNNPSVIVFPDDGVSVVQQDPLFTNSDALYPGSYSDPSFAGNSVTVNSTPMPLRSVIGGMRVVVTPIQDVEHNSVVINGGVITNGVYGGVGNSFNNTNQNLVTLTGGTISGGLYGGQSAGGSANHNQVKVLGGTISGDVYGGFGNLGANGNSVIIAGGTITGGVYGGFSGGDVFSSNTLHKNSKTSLDSVNNFEFIHFGYAGDAGIKSLSVAPTGIAGTIPLVKLNTNHNNIVFNGLMDDGTGTGGIEKLGSGTLTLHGAAIFKAETLITEGTLQIGSGSVAGAITLNGGALAFAHPTDTYVNHSLITGDGTLQFHLGARGHGAVLVDSTTPVELSGSTIVIRDVAAQIATGDKVTLIRNVIGMPKNAVVTSGAHSFVLAVEKGALVAKVGTAAFQEGSVTISLPAGKSALPGVRLTAEPSGFTPEPKSYIYQWYRGSLPIGGATAKTYTLTADDAGRNVKVKVAANAMPGYHSSGEKQSPQLAVGNIAFQAGTVTVSAPAGRSALPGVRLTAEASGFTPEPKSYTYQWYRGATAIPGATGRTYLLTVADAESHVRVQVTANAMPGYDATAAKYPARFSWPVTFVGRASYTGGSVTVSTTGGEAALPGVRLTASPIGFNPEPVNGYAYQWYRGNTAIKGATAKTYLLSADDAGQKVRVKVAARPVPGYNASAEKQSAAVSVGTAAFKVGTVRISGSAQVGGTVTAQVQGFTPASSVTYTFRWYRSGRANPIATVSTTDKTATYAVVKADQGKELTVIVTATRHGHTDATATSTPLLIEVG